MEKLINSINQYLDRILILSFLQKVRNIEVKRLYEIEDIKHLPISCSRKRLKGLL